MKPFQTVTINRGASTWLKENRFWLPEWGNSIDGATGKIFSIDRQSGIYIVFVYGINEKIGIHKDLLTLFKRLP